jgi:hypothetical protein
VSLKFAFGSLDASSRPEGVPEVLRSGRHQHLQSGHIRLLVERDEHGRAADLAVAERTRNEPV